MSDLNTEYANHLYDLMQLKTRTQKLLDNVKRMRKQAKKIRRSIENTDTKIDPIREDNDELMQDCKDVQELLDVDIYLKEMIVKLNKYGRNICLEVFDLKRMAQKDRKLIRDSKSADNVWFEDDPWK